MDSADEWKKKMCYLYTMSIIKPQRRMKYVTFRKIDGTGDNHVRRNKLDSERQILNSSLICSI
jgi:hypothetical protein